MRAVVGCAILGAAALATVWAVSYTRPVHDAVRPPPPAPAAETLSSAELRRLNAEVAFLRGRVRDLEEKASDRPPAAVKSEPRHGDKELLHEPSLNSLPPGAHVVPTEDRDAHIAIVDKRFASLEATFRSQPRDPTWAQKEERFLADIPGSHDYFRGTNFDVVECRSEWCRVVARHVDATVQDLFQETFPTFASDFRNISLHPVTGTRSPQTEIFLSRSGPLPM